MAECSRPRCTDEPRRSGMCVAHYKKWSALGATRQVDASIVAARLTLLHVVYGWKITDIAARVGRTREALTQIRSGLPLKVRRDTAERIMAIPPVRPEHGRVPSIGFARRARALARIGHGFEAQSRALGWYSNRVRNHLRQATVPNAVHTAMCAYYDRMCLTPGTDTRRVRQAIRQGFAGPLAWDDDPRSPHYIDGWDATPYDTEAAKTRARLKYERDRARELRGEYRLTDAAQAREHVRRLREEFGWSLPAIAHAADVTLEGVRGIAYRQRRVQRDRAARVLALPLRPPPRAAA